MAITSMDTLVAGMTSGQVLAIAKASLSATAGLWTSMWTAGGTPCLGATPAAGGGAVPTNNTGGALPTVNPTGGNFAYLSGVGLGSQQAGVITIYDRLVHTSGLSGTSIVAQTVNSVAITRPDANGDGVEAWLEIYTVLGTSARTATVSYTNQAGTAGRTGTALITASSKVAHMFPISLQSGDTGVQSVQTVTLSGTTGAVGDFGITLMRRLGEVVVLASGISVLADPFRLGLPRIFDDACLALMMFTQTTSTGVVCGLVKTAKG